LSASWRLISILGVFASMSICTLAPAGVDASSRRTFFLQEGLRGGGYVLL
jgi:hypothetical protein